ncbi:MAG: DUF2924 domain-containing protein [Sphingopyxis sp.]|nr:DUF2924 domain-containing protein [Sphingopyxis sp.]
MSRRSSAVRDTVAAIAAMPLAELRAEWERRYGAAPRHRSAELLRCVLAWRVQADALGGFDTMTLKLLARDDAPLNLPPVAGMRLAREWAGKVHEVVVLDKGIVYAGKRWRSLSQVARHITGMSWNGPRFFGLRGTIAR